MGNKLPPDCKNRSLGGEEIEFMRNYASGMNFTSCKPKVSSIFINKSLM